MNEASNLKISLTQFQNVANFKKLVDITSAQGFLIHDENIEPWFFSGFQYHDGLPYLHGPPTEGYALAETLSLPREQALADVLTLIRALQVIVNAKKADDIEIALDSVYLLDDGGILFLPAEVFRKIRLMATEEYKAAYSRINNPYAENERQRFSHVIGVLLYHILTGAYPYDGRDLDDLHTRIRHQMVTPPRHLFPELKADIADFLSHSFEDRRLPVKLADWEKAVSGWMKEGITRKLTDEEKTELGIEIGKLKKKHERRFKSGVFWEKHGKAVLIACLVTVAILITFGSIIGNALKPRRTAGFEPRAVLETYYQCFNKLDPELMQDCLQGNTAKEEVRRAEVLYVISRQNEYLSGANTRIQADLWEQHGRPAINPPRFIDGVTALAITRESPVPQPVFLTEYERWVMDNEKDPQTTKGVIIQRAYRVKERVTLTEDTQGWLISKIEKLENKLIYENSSGYQAKKAEP